MNELKEKLQAFLNKPNGLPILLTVLGVILLLFPGIALKTVVRLAGIALIIGGADAIIAWNRNRTANSSYLDVAGGAVAVIGGLFLLIKPETLINIFPTIAGILVILYGAFYFLKALASKRTGFDKWKVSMVLAVVIVILGIYVLVRPFSTMKLLVRVLGGVLIYNGLSSLWIATRSGTTTTNAK